MDLFCAMGIFRIYRSIVRELCSVFCCPPCPGRIAAKIAFHPPQPTYELIPIDESPNKYAIRTLDGNDWQFQEHLRTDIESFFTKTSRENKIACTYARCNKRAKYTLLFSHGNAVDIGHMINFYIFLGSQLNCNIFSYDYSGYGMSEGKPTEKNMYADIEAAWQAMTNRLNISADSIILYGQSIGTVPTIDLATRYKVAAIILHSPLMSGMRMLFQKTKRTCFLDAFPSIDKISKVNSPVLVIHGTDDRIVNFSHGLGIYEKCPLVVEPLWIEGAGHNDIELYSQYYERLKHFVTEELAGFSNKSK